MVNRIRPSLALLCLSAACGDAGRTAITLPSDAPPPSLAGGNVAIAATVGTAFTYDATRAGATFANPAGGGPLTYAIAFAGPRSVGITGALTARHATGLANARFYGSGRFFWDERAASLEAQVLEPIQHRDEMGMSLDSLALKLAVTPYYPAVRGGVRIPVDHERPRRRGAGAVRSRDGVGGVAL